MVEQTGCITVEDYGFDPGKLAPANRSQGISAFMRVKNGADFIEATIRSHMPFVDEIVVVLNQCTDASPDIVMHLQAEFGPHRLRVFRYLPIVFPPGSTGHAEEPASSPRSFVTMSNFALAQTRNRIVLKLDDDHVAMERRVATLTDSIRKAGCTLDYLMCFSGVNLARDEAGRVGVPAHEPLAGAGDHFYFEVASDTYFVHDTRHEDFRRGGKPRRFADFAYWHMKYLKPDLGFGNREIDEGTNARFARKRAALLANRRVTSLHELVASVPWWSRHAHLLPLPEKARLIADRWQRLATDGPTNSELDQILSVWDRPTSAHVSVQPSAATQIESEA